MPALPFKPNRDRRHHIPRQKHKVTNWPAYEAGLRQRGSLTVWFTEEAVEAWAAEPRTARGGQPWYSPLAILTALPRRTVFRLALRQTEGLIGSILHPCSASSLPCRTTRHSAAGRDPGGAVSSVQPRLRSRAPAGGQHRPQAGRPWRMADREARHQATPLLAQAAPGRGRRHRPDRSGGADDQRRR